jgi:hypothetical protein
MGIARSTYYDAPMQMRGDAALLVAITAICDEFEAYGWRRVRAALRQQGVVANHKRIRRLMREHGLQPKRRRRFAATTDNNHNGPIFPDRAKDLVLTGRDQLWVADLPYVVIPGGITCVAVILDGLVAPRRWLRHRAFHRRASGDGCPDGGDRIAKPARGLRASLRQGVAIRCADVSEAADRAWPRRLNGAARQSLRQRQGGELHEDTEGRGGLPDGLREPRGRRRPSPQIHRRSLQSAPLAFGARLPEPCAVRGPTDPGHGQSRRLTLSGPRGPLQVRATFARRLTSWILPSSPAETRRPSGSTARLRTPSECPRYLPLPSTGCRRGRGRFQCTPSASPASSSWPGPRASSTPFPARTPWTHRLPRYGWSRNGLVRWCFQGGPDLCTTMPARPCSYCGPSSASA